ncbi:MAG TPA: hypothetical protein VM533_12215 [Fimbriiglobus sp.]|jgi:hypothetical protein|nr:hypothetical protein [Fimbriiglobus sp.]
MSSTLAGRARFVAGAALVAAVVGLAGCGDGGPKIVPVSGIVLIDGQPLTYGHIQVIPSGWRPASGRIGGDGRFTLTTTVSGDGCAVGTHPVAILAGESLTPETTKWHAPQKYADVTTSDLKVTITGPTDDLKIELKSDGSNKPNKSVKEGGTENSGFDFDK